MKYSRAIWISVWIFFAGWLLNSIDLHQEGIDTFSQAFCAVYGYVSFSDSISMFITGLKWMLPQISLLLFWGNAQEEHLGRCLPYIRVRTSRLVYYLMRLDGKLCTFTAITCLIWELMTLYHAWRCELPLGTIGDLAIRILVYFLYQCFILLTVNMISGFMKAIYGMGMVIGAELVGLELLRLIQGGILPETLWQWIPASWTLFYYQPDRSLLPVQALLLLAGIIIVFLLNEKQLRKKELF